MIPQVLLMFFIYDFLCALYAPHIMMRSNELIPFKIVPLINNVSKGEALLNKKLQLVNASPLLK